MGWRKGLAGGLMAVALCAAAAPASAQSKPLPGLANDKAADLYEQGQRLVKKGKHELAIKSFDASAKAAPLFHLAPYAAGNVLAQLGKRREAMKRYEDAVARKPDFVNGWNAIGVLHITAADYEKALVALDKAIRADPDHLLSRQHRAQALLQLKRAPEAERELRAILARKPGHADATVDLAAARSMQGDPRGAMTLVDELLKKKPKHGRALLLRAQLLENEGELYRAASALKTVLERAGKDKTTRMRAGQAADRIARKAHKKQDHQTQVRALETLVLVLPKSAATRARFGATLIAWYESQPEGKKDAKLKQRAVRELEASLKIDPDQPAVKSILEEYR